MSDHSNAARLDTFVIDDPDDQWRPSRQLEEVVMQVFCVGTTADDAPSSWHRMMPNHQSTACGIEFHANFSSLRREALTEPLCPVCFTERERTFAADAVNESNSQAIDQRRTVRQWLDEQERLADARTANREATPKIAKPRRKR